MKIYLALVCLVFLFSCSPKSGNIWIKTEINPIGASVVDTVEMKFKRYGNAFSVRRPYAIYELYKGHTNIKESGWKAVMFVQDPWPEVLKFKNSVWFRKITFYEDRYSKVYVVEYKKKDPYYNSKMTIHVITETGCTLYIAK